MTPHLPLCGAVLALTAVLVPGQPVLADEPSADSTSTSTPIPGNPSTTTGDAAGSGDAADVACDSAGYLWSYIMDVSELEAGSDPQTFQDADSGLEVQVGLDAQSTQEDGAEAEGSDSTDESDAEASSVSFSASRDIDAATLQTLDTLRTYTFDPAIASAGALTADDEAGSVTSLTLCWGEDPENPVNPDELPRTGWGTPMVIALAVALGAIGVMLGLSSRLLSFPGTRR